jgi:curli biogenesis system outer membrane secretion channel CsgG
MSNQIKSLILFLILGHSIIINANNLPIIAITEIQSSVDSNYWRDFKNSKSSNFQTMLETQLVQTNRFKIIERNRIDEVLSEQILQGNFSDSNTQIKAGAVDYIVYGSITKFGSKRKTIKTSGINVTKLISEFGVDLKLVDVTTGEIVKAKSIDETIETGASTSTNSFGASDVLADPLSEIQRTAAKSAAALIAESIFPIKVVAWEDDGNDCCGYLNYGESILSEGDILNIIKQGSSFIDPDTGISLGSTEKIIGSLRVIEVLEKFSKATLLEGKKPSGGEVLRSKKIVNKKFKNSSQRKKLGKEI